MMLIIGCDCHASSLKLSVALRYWVGDMEWSDMDFIFYKALAYRAFLCTYKGRFGFQMSHGQQNLASPEAPHSHVHCH